MGFDIGSLFAGGVDKIITAGGNVMDELITSKEEEGQLTISMEELKNAKRQMELDFKLESKRQELSATETFLSDRKSARDMYMKDSSLQKTFALVFLIFYCLISAGMIAMIISMAFFSKTIDLPEWGVMLISSVFTGMSMKVNTITDFLFGGSKTSDDSAASVTQSFQQGNVK